MTGRDEALRARAIALTAVALVLSALALVFQVVSGHPDVAETLLMATFAVFGGLVALRVPRNAYGWLFLVIAAVNSFSQAGTAVMLAARDVWQMPAVALTAAVASSWQWFAFIGTIATFCLLLFPDGRLPSPRWRWVAYLAVAVMAVGSALLLVATALDPHGAVHDPDGDVGPPVLGPIFAVLGALLLVCAIASIASLVVRWRNAHGVQRQQLKWFLFGGVLQIGGIAAGFFTHPLASFITEASILSLPGAATLAILRYRLYDIDRIISRTLGYAVLTVVLGGVYLGVVTLLTALTAPVTGRSPLAVAAATLLAAAAFGPARRRIQSSVDRRSNRARYDAERILASYRARLRDALDLGALEAELRVTLQQTVQPAALTLWLRADVRSGR